MGSFFPFSFSSKFYFVLWPRRSDFPVPAACINHFVLRPASGESKPVIKNSCPECEKWGLKPSTTVLAEAGSCHSCNFFGTSQPVHTGCPFNPTLVWSGPALSFSHLPVHWSQKKRGLVFIRGDRVECHRCCYVLLCWVMVDALLEGSPGSEAGAWTLGSVSCGASN